MGRDDMKYIGFVLGLLVLVLLIDGFPTGLQTAPLGAPQITSITPEVLVSDVDRLLKVTGSNFIPGASLLVEGQVYVYADVRSPTELWAWVVQGTPPATYSLSVKNPDNQVSNTVPLTITSGPAGNNDVVGHYQLDEIRGATTFSNTAQNQFHGSCPSASCPFAGVKGKLNTAVHFDGTDDYITLGNMDISGNAVTIAAWVNFDTFSVHDARIVSKAKGVAEQDHWWMLSTIDSSGSKLRFRLKTGSTTSTLIPGSVNLKTGVWTHVAAVYDGTNMLLYQDGVEVARMAKSGQLAANNQLPVWIGGNPDGSTSRPFDGKIDDVRIYKKALSAQEVKDLAKGSGGCQGPVCPISAVAILDQFGFNVDMDPKGGIITPGGTTSTTLSVKQTGGTKLETFSFKVEGLPITVGTATFAQGSCTITNYKTPCTDTLNIKTLASAPIGLYMLTVTVTGGGQKKIEKYILNIQKTGVKSVSVVPSRTSGVAPLLVHFDATGTTAIGINRPFHNLDYQWNFGDSSAGTWDVSKKNKNTDAGPVAAHVFEKPGTYTVTLTVKDATGNTGTKLTTITVQDPNVVFSGTNTVCFSTGTDFTGCPAGALTKTETKLENMQQYLRSNMRILLKRGDIWTWTQGKTKSPWTIPLYATQGIIGAFGKCLNPSPRGVCANAPMLEKTTVGASRLINVDETKDWRIMDVQFKGVPCDLPPGHPVGCSSAIGGIENIQELLMLRLKAEGFTVPIGNGIYCYQRPGGPKCRAYHDVYGLVDSEIFKGYVTQVYLGAERLVTLGNVLYDSYDSHVMRSWQSYKAVINHNSLSGSSLKSGTARHALKLHGPTRGENPYNLKDTQLSVIANNMFGTSGVWPVAMGPQSPGGKSDERVYNVLFEKNRIFANAGNLGTKPDSGMTIWARDITVRNNIFDATGAKNDYTAIGIWRRSIEPAPKDIVIDNNLVYRSDVVTGTVRLVNVKDNVNSVLIRNNIVYAPNTGKTILNEGTGAVTEKNNLVAIDPKWVNPQGRDFHLTKGPAVDTGTKVPVFDDFEDNKRPKDIYDKGPYEFQG